MFFKLCVISMSLIFKYVNYSSKNIRQSFELMYKPYRQNIFFVPKAFS